MPQVEVEFDIDANGILNVKASDKATGRRPHITITASSGLSDNEVKEMVKNAEKFAAEDSKRKERIEVRNNADSMVYTAEKTLRDLGDKVQPDVKSEVEAKATALKSVLDSASVDELKRKTEELGQVVQDRRVDVRAARRGHTTRPRYGRRRQPDRSRRRRCDRRRIHEELTSNNAQCPMHDAQFTIEH